MITFTCKNCGQKLSVKEEHSGTRIKCPKCGHAGVVPETSDEIKFHCKSCGQNIRVPQIHAGKKGKCPKCKTPIVVPSLKREPVGPIASGPSIPPGADEDSYEDKPDLPEEGGGLDRRLIFVICGAAAVVVVGIIIVVAVILRSGSGPAEEPDLSLRQRVADADSRPQPVASDTEPAEAVTREPPKEDRMPEESVSSDKELMKETKIAFASDRDGNYEIYTMNEDGSGLKRLTNSAADDLFISWSPDGKKIAFESRIDGNPEICVMNADGSEQTNLTNSASRDHVPSWSPDGRKIVFYSLKDNYEIHMMNPDGSELKRLTRNRAHDMGPSWSPDGMKIAFVSERDGNFEIYVMNPDGSEQTRLTNNPARDMSPSWSPDGKKIVFTSNRDGNYEVYVMSADCSEQSRLTNNPANEGSASWSPDGNKIAFVSDRDGNREIYVMNAGGSELIRLTNNPAADRWPVWLPIHASEQRATQDPENRREKQEVTAGNIDLKLRLKPGLKHHLQIAREYNRSLTFKGQQHDNSTIHIIGLEFEVEQVDANGVTLLKVTHLTANAITKTERGQREYDSAKPDTVGEYHLGPVLSAMIGQSFVAKVTPEGKIVELKGLAEMYQRIAEPVVEYEDEATRQQYARLETRGSEEAAKRWIERVNQKHGSREKRIEATREKLEKGFHSSERDIREMVGNVIMSFPGEPVGIGYSWPAWIALFSDGGLDLDNCTYTLRDKKQTAMLVDTNSKIEVDEEETIPDKDGNIRSLRTILTGSCEGSLEIDLSTGWMLHKNVTLRCSGEVKTASTERTPQVTITPISMEIVTTVKPIE